MSDCPVCDRPCEVHRENMVESVKCPRCGTFLIEEDAVGKCRRLGPLEKTAVSHHIRKSFEDGRIVNVDIKFIDNSISGGIPSPFEQIDNIINIIGSKSSFLGDLIVFNSIDDALMGVVIGNSIMPIINEAESDGCVALKIRRSSSCKCYLTMKGWRRYEEIKSGAASSKTAFMALQYGNKDFDDFIDSCFRPAVKQTGFRLFRQDDEPRMGLIDDWLRVQIKACRFMIADMSDNNGGAYWEAGYAEGLGKPVIYTCKKGEQEKIHFDTNHHLTVTWDPENPYETARQLKATIRCSIPEAIQTDSDDLLPEG